MFKLSLKQRDSIRDRLNTVAGTASTAKERRRLRRITENARAFDRFIDRAEKEYIKARKKDPTLGDDDESFFQWLVKWIKENPLVIINIITAILSALLLFICVAFAMFAPTRGVAQTPAPVVTVTTPAPAPDKISTPTVPVNVVVPTAVAEFEGPTTVRPGKAFVVYYRINDPKDGCKITWDNHYPEGAIPPFKSATDDGRMMLIFLESVEEPGAVYKFYVKSQYPSIDPPLDPLAEDAHVVTVEGKPKPKPTDPETPDVPDVDPTTPTTKATSVTWVYEKDEDGAPPSYVETGLNRLNREKKVVATLCEDDPDVGTGQVPSQYKVQIEEARKTVGPDLIIMADSTILKSIKGADVKTEDDVVNSAP